MFLPLDQINKVLAVRVTIAVGFAWIPVITLRFPVSLYSVVCFEYQ